MLFEINEFRFAAIPDPFWGDGFAAWEPETKQVYAKYCRPDKSVIDLGAWLGPTVFLGFANNAKHIYAVEADPRNFHVLKQNCKRNSIDDRTTLINRCIYPVSREIVNFGKPLVEGTRMTSTLSLGGDIKVITSTLGDIIKDNSIEISDVSLLKVDIEGSELFLVDDLCGISIHKDLVISLSLHPQFWHNIPAKPQKLSLLFECYDFYTDREEPLRQDFIPTYINGWPDGCMVVLKPKGRADSAQ